MANPITRLSNEITKFRKKRKDKAPGNKSFLRGRKKLILSLTAFIIFYGAFLGLISSGLLINKVGVNQGEVSPVEFIAPYGKSVEVISETREKRRTAVAEVQPAYKVNDQVISNLEQRIDQSFNKIVQAELLTASDQQITALRTDSVFNQLDTAVLQKLFVGARFPEIRDVCKRVVLEVAGSSDAGAKKTEEMDSMRDEMGRKIREEINKLQFTDVQIPEAYAAFMGRFLDSSITEPTMVLDEEETERARSAAREQVQPTMRMYQANELIVTANKVISEDDYQALKEFNLIKSKSIALPFIGIALAVLLGMILFLFFTYRFQKELFDKLSHLVLMGIMMVLILGFARAMLSITLDGADNAYLLIFLIPVAWLTMTLTIMLGHYTALSTGFVVVFYMVLMYDPSFNTSVQSFLLIFTSIIGAFGGIISISALKRPDMVRSGRYLIGINVAGVLCLCFVLNFSWQSCIVYTLAMAVNGLLSSVLMIGTLPWLERSFGITSSMRLLELTDSSNPLLSQLSIDAPGTHHHSIIVANMAEAAAEQVGANGLLVRVGALYHDIGKLKRPYFFIENQIGMANPHDKITATLSALIILSHVKDGIELANKHRLPESVKDIIRQHHGDSMARYFYIKALNENPKTPEEAFRYDGPKPMSKESAIVLLADSVEAVIRSHQGNTAGRLKALVHKIIQNKADEGLLSESELTFKDLSVIASAFIKVLSGSLHSRITYPEMPGAKLLDDRRKLINTAKRVQEEEKSLDRPKDADTKQEPAPREGDDSQRGEEPQKEPDVVIQPNRHGMPDFSGGLSGREGLVPGEVSGGLSAEITARRRQGLLEGGTSPDTGLGLRRKPLSYGGQTEGHPEDTRMTMMEDLDFSSDEFEQMIYMTGSRFSMENFQKNKASKDRPLHEKKPSKQKHASRMKRQLKKK